MKISSFYISVPKIMIRWHTVPKIWCVTDVIVTSHFGLFFFPFYPPNSLKNQNFEKMNNMPWDIIILHMCTKNYDQIMCSSWDMVCDGCNYFSSSAIFCSFTTATVQKIKILKKWKNCLPISSLYIDVPKIMIRWCTVREIWCVTGN